MSYRLRDATLKDARALAKLHVQTYQETHGGGPTVAIRFFQWTQNLSRGSKSDFTVLVEDEEGRLVGFARAHPTPADEVSDWEGHLNKIYVLRSHHRQGIGRMLLREVAQRLLAMGIHSMNLFGEAGNPSNGFYERLGAERTYAENGDFHGGYGWRDLRQMTNDD
jgi:GNAT superfamily N-acetyltransferase